MFMGAVPIMVGIGFIVRVHFVPLLHGILTVAPAETGTLSLPNPRVASVR
jgi:hypothetical protein